MSKSGPFHDRNLIKVKTIDRKIAKQVRVNQDAQTMREIGSAIDRGDATAIGWVAGKTLCDIWVPGASPIGCYYLVLVGPDVTTIESGLIWTRLHPPSNVDQLFV